MESSPNDVVIKSKLHFFVGHFGLNLIVYSKDRHGKRVRRMTQQSPQPVVLITWTLNLEPTGTALNSSWYSCYFLSFLRAELLQL